MQPAYTNSPTSTLYTLQKYIQWESALHEEVRDGGASASRPREGADTVNQRWTPVGLDQIFCHSDLWIGSQNGDKRVPLSPATDCILDAGTGVGLLCAQMASCYGIPVYGVELVQDYVDSYRKHIRPKLPPHANVVLEQGSFTEKPIPGKALWEGFQKATVVMFNNLKFAESGSGVQTAFLQNLARHLSKHGYPERTLRIFTSAPIELYKENNTEDGATRYLLHHSVPDVHCGFERTMPTVFAWNAGKCYVYRVFVKSGPGSRTALPNPMTDAIREREQGSVDKVKRLIRSAEEYARDYVAFNRAGQDEETGIRSFPREIFDAWERRLSLMQVAPEKQRIVDPAAFESSLRPHGELRVTRRLVNEIPYDTSLSVHAKRDAHPDDVLVQGNATVFIVIDGSETLTCARCLKHEPASRGKSPIKLASRNKLVKCELEYARGNSPISFPCGTCERIFYCSEECRKSDKALHKQYECTLLKHHAYTDILALLAKSFRPDERPDGLAFASAMMRLAMRIMARPELHKNLSANAEQRTPAETHWHTAIGKALAVALGHTEIDIWPKLITRCLQIAEATHYSVDIPGDTYQRAFSLSAQASFLNHSCVANCKISHVRKDREPLMVQVIATRDIEPSQELTLNYISDIEDATVRERRSVLIADQQFSCKCPRCTEEMEAMKEQPDNLRWVAGTDLV